MSCTNATESRERSSPQPSDAMSLSKIVWFSRCRVDLRSFSAGTTFGGFLELAFLGAGGFSLLDLASVVDCFDEDLSSDLMVLAAAAVAIDLSVLSIDEVTIDGSSTISAEPVDRDAETLLCIFFSIPKRAGNGASSRASFTKTEILLSNDFFGSGNVEGIVLLL